MAETSAPWDGTTTGDATIAPYDAPTEWAAYWRSVAGASAIPTNLGGVFAGELNELAVTAPGAISPAVVATGSALAYGTHYNNSASVNVAIATPAASTRIDRIVLRKDWTAQTVRITRIAGVEGGAAPAMTQTPGVTWDTPLAQVSITTGGVITVTDGRQFVPYGVTRGCRLQLSAATQTLANSTSTALVLKETGSGNFDTFGFHSDATNPSRITITQAGTYLLQGQIGWTANATGDRRAEIVLNGGSTIASDWALNIAAVNPTIQGVSALYQLVAGDYVELMGRQNSGGNLTVDQGYTYFSAVRLGS